MNSYDFGFADIHCHILPGIDDGAKNYDETKRILEIAYEENIRCMFATPHFRAGTNMIEAAVYDEKLGTVHEIAQSIASDFCIVAGNELYYNDDAVTDLKESRCRTLAQSQYVLVEFHPQQDFRGMRLGLSRLLSAGYWPILAHIERYNCLRNTPGYVNELFNMRVYFQVNANSIMEKKAFGVGAWIRKLMSAGKIHFVATDCHNTKNRPPELMKSVDYIAGKFGLEYVKKLLYDNPRRIMNNEYI